MANLRFSWFLFFYWGAVAIELFVSLWSCIPHYETRIFATLVTNVSSIAQWSVCSLNGNIAHFIVNIYWYAWYIIGHNGGDCLQTVADYLIELDNHIRYHHTEFETNSVQTCSNSPSFVHQWPQFGTVFRLHIYEKATPQTLLLGHMSQNGNQIWWP